jgi:hypothetical protein
MELNKLLFWVVGIYILFKFENSIVNNINDNINKLNYINYTIKRYENLLQNKNKIEKTLSKSINVDKENKKYFFSKKMTNNEIYVKLQNIIKENAKKAGFDLNNFKWELVKERDFYYLVPIQANFETLPENFSKFLKLMCKEEKIFKNTFLKVSAISNYRNDTVKYQIEFSALKLKGKF